MLSKRILTAVIGIPVAIYLINTGGFMFVTAISILAVIAWDEYKRMMAAKGICVWSSIGFIGVLLSLGCAWVGNSQESVMVIFSIVFLTLMRTVVSQAEFKVTDAAFTVLGTLYISIPFSHLILLRFTEQYDYIHTALGTLSTGAAYLWLAFVGTWASDTFAYFVGSCVGKRKLCPSISPGKTFEGAAGGLAGSIIGVAALGALFGLPLYHTLFLGILVGIVAPFGDLVESALKRFTGVKDSGNILPGHGGVLDRFDAVMFSAPVVYYYIKAFI